MESTRNVDREEGRLQNIEAVACVLVITQGAKLQDWVWGSKERREGLWADLIF